MSAVVSVSRDVAASPEVVFALVSDLTRMGEWSPENTGGRWAKGATGPAVGATFKGTNANGRRKWTTDVTVTRCEPGVAFAFDVDAGPLAVANWAYTIEPTEGGCRVTETWVNRSGWLVRTTGSWLSGRKHDEAYTRTAMAETLDRLAAVAEAEAAA